MKSGTGGRYDRTIMVAALILMAVGCVMVYSASGVKAAELYGDPYHFFRRQLVFVILAVPLLGFCARIPAATVYRVALPLALLTAGLLVLVLIPGIGLKIGGARRWLGTAGARLQPSELARLALVVILARFLAVRLERGEEENTRLTLFPALFISGLLSGLVLLEPDFGTMAAMGGVTLCLIFVAGVPSRQIARIVTVGLVCLALLIASAGYRRSRFMAFLSPDADPAGSGYHVRQSLLAVGAGGVIGVGIGNSRQKLFYLPAAHTDFIFAVIAEETGLVGSFTVVLLVALILFRGLSIARRQKESFRMLLAVGLTTNFGLSALINFGTVLSLLPTTGMSLPLVSYGGSSLLCQSVSLGLLLSLSRAPSPPIRGRRGRR